MRRRYAQIFSNYCNPAGIQNPCTYQSQDTKANPGYSCVSLFILQYSALDWSASFHVHRVQYYNTIQYNSESLEDDQNKLPNRECFSMGVFYLQGLQQFCHTAILPYQAPNGFQLRLTIIHKLKQGQIRQRVIFTSFLGPSL